MSLSTYTSYLIVNKDMKTSLSRVASEAMVKRDTEYYQANIGKVTSVEEFMGDYRLYSYAMKAFGLEDMTYARAFMKKVLESDLSDSASFANKLTDKRYGQLAAAFNFAGETKVAQSTAQESNLLKAYESAYTEQEKAIATETTYYDKQIDLIADVDGLVKNARLITYALKANGIYNEYYSVAKIRDFLTSDLNDETSFASVQYVQKRAALATDNAAMQTGIDMVKERTTLVTANTELAAQLAAGDLDAETEAGLQAQYDANVLRIAEIEDTLGTSDSSALSALSSSFSAMISANNASIATIDTWLDFKAQFSFNPDGSLVNETAQTAEQKAAIKENYLLTQSTAPSYTLFLANKAHYESVIATVATVDELVADERALAYIKTAYGLRDTMYASTVAQILRSDPTDPNSVAAFMGYADVPKFFNFNTDGTLKEGRAAQDNVPVQTGTTVGGDPVMVDPLADIAAKYRQNFLVAHYNSVEAAAANYEKKIADVESLSDFFAKNTSDTDTTNDALPDLWEMALIAHGLNPDDFSKTKLSRILTSDLSDKKSYVYTLKDDRLVSLAEAFNFDAKGKTEVPLQAQSEFVVNDLTKAYRANMIRFLSRSEAEAAAEKADAEIEYYKEKIAGIKTVDEFLADKRLVDVALQSRGIDPKSVTTAELKKMFASDLSDPKSYVNSLADGTFAELIASFNFDRDGNIAEEALGTVQQRGDMLETINRYIRQSMEQKEGDSNAGVRLALYFERLAPGISSAYDILGDDALTEFFTTAFSLSTYIANMDVDKQAELVKKFIDLEKLQDPQYVASLIQRFTALYDAANSSATSPALSILSNSTTISADTLLAVAQLSAR